MHGRQQLENLGKKRGGKQMKPDYEQAAFNTFARLHPVEAYDSDPVRFCNFVRENNTIAVMLTDEEIKEIIEQTRRSK